MHRKCRKPPGGIINLWLKMIMYCFVAAAQVYAAAERTELFNRFLLPAIALILLEILLSQTLLRRFP